MTSWLRHGVVVAALLCGASCGRESATSPISAPVAQTPVVTPEMLVLTPVAPADEIVVPAGAGVVTLRVAAPAPPASGAAIVDVFEVGSAPDLSGAARHALVRTSTSSSYDKTISSFDVRRPLYWRARASSGEVHGAWTAVRMIRVVPDELQPPTLMDPVAGASVAGDYRFTMRGVSHTAPEKWSYDFEISRDEGFGEMVVQARVVEPTTSIVGLRPSPALPDGRYYWRGRTFDHQGNMSGYSEVRSFEVRAPFVDAPIPLTPAPGATVPQLPVFVLRNGVLFGSTNEGPRYEVQLSADPSFQQIVATASQWAQASGTTTIAVTSNIPGGSYYWRARAVLARTPSTPEMTSAWTDVRPVTVMGVVLAAPVASDPSSLATTAARPTFSATNAVSSGVSSGAVTYRFEVSPDIRFEASPIATGVVAEGIGVTRWTPPYDLPADVVLYWRVRAEHEATGTLGPYSPVTQFIVVDSQVQRYLLSMTIPAACGFDKPTPSFFVEAKPAADGSLVFTSRDASTSTADSLTITLTAGGAVTGTLIGTAAHDARQFTFRATASGQSPQTPATLVGSQQSGGWSGTGTTWVSEQIIPISYKPCGPTNISWSLTRR